MHFDRVTIDVIENEKNFFMTFSLWFYFLHCFQPDKNMCVFRVRFVVFLQNTKCHQAIGHFI